ncbi:MAG: molybdopterin dinucleotide binding domain-containing protein, partial [Gemmatimonadota bacterium]|nr:molybdopterin dinucleotide binding domain-containing protein [Gemmatimonadota bacterium]
MSIERREFLKLVGVTGAGTLTACDAKVGPKSLIPYLVPHEEVTPGVPTWYASTCRECPAGCGIHVKTREGRVVKIEGNPESPVNEGKLCARGQAAHQNLYDPDRLVGPKALRDGGYVDIGWEEGIDELARRLRGAREGSVVLLSGLQTGTRNRLYDEWAEAVGATRMVYEPFAHEALLEGNRRVLGRAVIPSYDLDAADFVISFGADFLETWVSPVKYGREWSRMHVYKEEGGSRGIFVAVEPRLSMTASNADEWVSAKPGTEYLIALGMANVLGGGGDATEWTPDRVARATGIEASKIEELARRFRDSRSVALPGGISTQHDRATAAAAAVALLNQAGGAIGDTVALFEPVTGGVENSYRNMIGLAERMRAGEVQALLVADANPVYSIPPALEFQEALKQVPFRVSFDPLFTETASWCHLLLPDHTPLESWGDWVPQQGVASLIQPAMRPVRNTRSTPDVMLETYRAVTDTPAASEGEVAGAGLDSPDWKTYLREAWRDRAPDRQAWADLLKSGGRWEGATPAGGGDGAGGTTAGAAATGGAAQAAANGERPLDYEPVESRPTGGEVFELLVYPHIAMYDGRNANRPWLQELPDPATTSCWQTWVEVNPGVADRLDLEDGDVVRISSDHGEVEAPVIVYAGIREDTVAMPLGRGHHRMGRYADNGTNPVALLPPKAEAASGALVYQGTRVAVEKTGAWVPPLKMQGSDSQHGRELAQSVPMAAALGNGHGDDHGDDHEEEGAHHGEPLTVERVAEDSQEESPYRWGMAISLDACTGCGACVTACMAENNLPFVGPERVAKSRQMQWI